jgi:hypothetical protein
MLARRSREFVMPTHQGGCHCGNIGLGFTSGVDPHAMEVRACQCSFCRRHGSLAAADPQGRLRITVRDPSALLRYAFGLRTADYLVCRGCGVYVAAVIHDEEPRAIVIVNALDDRDLFDRKPLKMSYDAESREERIARRRERWMPVAIEVRSA